MRSDRTKHMSGVVKIKKFIPKLEIYFKILTDERLVEFRRNLVEFFHENPSPTHEELHHHPRHLLVAGFIKWYKNSSFSLGL